MVFEKYVSREAEERTEGASGHFMPNAQCWIPQLLEEELRSFSHFLRWIGHYSHNETKYMLVFFNLTHTFSVKL